MNFQTAMKIAASGMSAQRLRLNLISSNLANANTTRSADGGPYKRQDAIFKPEHPVSDFDKFLTEMEEMHMHGVTVDQISESDKTRREFSPHSPDADKDGYVELPDVNVVQEMVDLLQATRSYEANVQAVKALKTMASQALNISS